MEQLDYIKKNLRIEHTLDDDIISQNILETVEFLKTYVTSRPELFEQLNEHPLFKRAVTVQVIYTYNIGGLGANIRWNFNESPPTFPQQVLSLLGQLRREVPTWIYQE